MLFTHPIPDNIEAYYKSDTYISHTDTNKTLIDKVYKKVRTYTLHKKLKLINSYNKKDSRKILDIGAGTGDFLKICKENNWDVVGVEPSAKAREIAIKKNINLIPTINSIDTKFDIITMWHVLEHVINLEDYIKTLKKLLTKNGVLIIAVPNYKSYDANYYKQHWAAYDVPRHIWHFSKNSISKLFLKVTMKVVKIKPMIFDSFYVSLLSEKNKHGTFNPIKAFIIGFISNTIGIIKKEHSSHIYIIKNNNKSF